MITVGYYDTVERRGRPGIQHSPGPLDSSRDVQLGTVAYHRKMQVAACAWDTYERSGAPFAPLLRFHWPASSSVHYQRSPMSSKVNDPYLRLCGVRQIPSQQKMPLP